MYNRALIIESVSVISFRNKFKVTSSHIKIHVPAKNKLYKYCWNVLFRLRYRSWKPVISRFTEVALNETGCAWHVPRAVGSARGGAGTGRDRVPVTVKLAWFPVLVVVHIVHRTLLVAWCSVVASFLVWLVVFVIIRVVMVITVARATVAIPKPAIILIVIISPTIIAVSSRLVGVTTPIIAVPIIVIVFSVIVIRPLLVIAIIVVVVSVIVRVCAVVVSLIVRLVVLIVTMAIPVVALVVVVWFVQG